MALGIHQAIVDDTVRFCRGRELYGEPLARLPTIAVKLGEMQSRLMAARLAQVALGEYPRGWSERLRDACQSLVEPSGPIVVDGLCATSQAWPSGSTNTPE